MKFAKKACAHCPFRIDQAANVGRLGAEGFLTHVIDQKAKGLSHECHMRKQSTPKVCRGYADFEVGRTPSETAGTIAEYKNARRIA